MNKEKFNLMIHSYESHQNDLSGEVGLSSRRVEKGFHSRKNVLKRVKTYQENEWITHKVVWIDNTCNVMLTVDSDKTGVKFTEDVLKIFFAQPTPRYNIKVFGINGFANNQKESPYINRNLTGLSSMYEVARKIEIGKESGFICDEVSRIGNNFFVRTPLDLSKNIVPAKIIEIFSSENREIKVFNKNKQHYIELPVTNNISKQEFNNLNAIYCNLLQ